MSSQQQLNQLREEFYQRGLELETAKTQVACLEGEIAKRDARIVELERAEKNDAIAYKAALERQDELRAELSALKAQVVMLADTRHNRVYLAGPMTGIEDYNFPAFNAEAARLRATGLHVENPAEHGIVDGADWADYLRYDIGRLATCEKIHLLPGWSKSKGVKLELQIAQSLGMGICYADGAEEVAPAQQVSVPDGWKQWAVGDTVRYLGGGEQYEDCHAAMTIGSDYLVNEAPDEYQSMVVLDDDGDEISVLVGEFQHIAAAPAAPAADAGLVADARRWRFYAPMVAHYAGVTIEKMNEDVDEALAAHSKGVV